MRATEREIQAAGEGSNPFIERPVMTDDDAGDDGDSLFGVIAYTRLPVADLPRFEVPTILAAANNQGSNAAMLLANYANTDLSLWPGRYCTIELALYDIPNAILIPVEAIEVDTKGHLRFRGKSG